MSHSHGWPYEDPATHKCVEIDPAVCLRPTVHGGDPDVTNADGSIAGGSTEHLAGFIVAHDRPGFDVRCECHVTVDPHFGDARWDMTGSLEGGDLTLSPSILCRLGSADPAQECGFHGYVRGGKWVPA